MRAGNVLGLEALIRAYGGRVKGCLRTAFGLRPGDHLLDDAIHDAGCSLLRYAKRLDPNQNLGGYYYRSARREMLRLMRGSKWHKSLDSDAVNHIPAPQSSPDETDGVSKGVAAVVDGLPMQEREVLALDVAHGFGISASEIANILGTSVGTVYALRNRTKGRLKKFVQGDPNEGIS